MKRITLVLLLFVFTVGLMSFGKQRQGFVINVELSGFPDSTQIVLLNERQNVIASSKLVNGKAFLTGQLSEPQPLVLIAKDKDQPFNYLLIGNEKILITGDKSDFPNRLRVTGSKNEDDFIRYMKLISSYESKINSAESSKKLSNNMMLKDSIKIAFVKSNINTYIALFELGNLTSKIPVDTVRKLYNSLTPAMKLSQNAKNIKVFLDSKIVNVGDKAQDFEAYNRKGEKVKLFDIKDKYILLEFAQVNCGPCKQAVKRLQEIAATCSDSLAVVSFFCDPEESWLRELTKERVEWLSVWDGNYFDSETIIKYGVHGFPTFFLISKDKTVLSKDVGFGGEIFPKELEKLQNK